MSETQRKSRTLSQNAALHLYCERVAEALNDAGYDMRTFPWKDGIEVPWTKYSVKEYLYKHILEAMTGKKSTTEMDTVDPGDVYEVMNRALGEKVGIHVPWPSEETLSEEQR